MISPLSELRFLDAPMPRGPFSGVIFTSESAVEAFLRVEPRRDLAAWAVGPRTAKAARTAGFDVTVGPGNGADLAAMIAARNPKGTILYPHGRHTAFPMAETLKSAGIDTVSVTLYETVGLPPSAEARALLAGPAPVVAPLFSARGAEAFSTIASGAISPIRFVAISDAVADALGAIAAHSVTVATRPDATGVLDALAQFAPDRHQG